MSLIGDTRTQRRRLMSTRRLLLVGALTCLLTCVAWLKLSGPLPGETAVEHAVISLDPLPKQVLSPLVFIGSLGDPVIALVLLAMFSAVLFERSGLVPAVVMLAGGAGVVPATILKHLIGTTVVLYGRPGGMPSGHTVFVATVFGLAGWAAWGTGYRVLAVCLWWWVALIGPALVVLSAHLPSDVICGYAFALAWAIGVVEVADKWKERHQHPDS